MLTAILAATLSVHAPSVVLPPLGAAAARPPALQDAAAPSTPEAQLPAVRFPKASGQLVLAVDEAGQSMSYEQLVDRYAELTGVAFTFSEDTEALLKSGRIRLNSPMVVEPADVPRIAETLLFNGGFALGLMPSDAQPMVKVLGLESQERGRIRAHAVPVPADQLGELDEHPATIVSVSLTLPNLDVRQVSNTMRTTIVDANMQMMLPAGNSNSMLLVGPGSQVAGMARLLRSFDEAASTSAPRSVVRVVRLNHANAEALCTILTQVFNPPTVATGQGAPQRVKAPVVMADPRTNSLVVRGNSQDVEEVLTVVAELDRKTD